MPKLQLEGNPVLTNLDIAKTGKPLVIRAFDNVEITGKLDITLTAKSGQTVLCGVELVEAQ